MKRIRYSKYVPDPAVRNEHGGPAQALSDYLLQSGFRTRTVLCTTCSDGEQTLDDLRQAIEQALLNSDASTRRCSEQIEQMQMEGKLDELIEQLIERMQQEDYISIDAAA